MVVFHAGKVSARVTRIFGICTELMYLVEGTKRAALIDTGSGVGSLRRYVEALTAKPVVVLLTHGHVDHAMGAPEFDEVWMNHADDRVHRAHESLAVRRQFLELSPFRDDVEDADYVTPGVCENYRALRDGDSFDLGGVTVTMLACPGHTKGSMTALLREERMLLLGDACNPFTFLWERFSEPVAVYEESLKTLQAKTAGLYDRVLLSHGSGNGPADMIGDIIGVCEDIKAGNVDNVPYTFLGFTGGVVAKKMKRSGGRADGGVGNIVYNPNRIRA